MSQHTKCIVIAIDGPAASGKGVVAKAIAKHFGYDHMDTGRLYRAVSYLLMKNGVAPEDKEKVLHFARQASKNEQLIEGVVPEEELRAKEVCSMASKIGSIPELREILNEFQRAFPKGRKGAVLDGRDIGSSIFPDAQCKLYITAKLEIRAERRYKQLQILDKSIIYSEVVRDLKERDERDISRKVSPLQIPKGASILDTTDITQEEAIQRALEIVASSLANIND